MPIPISSFQSSNGVRVLPAAYANGLIAVSGFTTNSSLLVPLNPPLASGYNAIGEFFMVSNDGDATLQPTLTLSVPNFQIVDLQTGVAAANITLAFGEGVIIGMESSGSSQVVAIRLAKASSGPGYTLPPATASTLGGIKVGSGVTVQADGTISVATYTLPVATTTVLGGVKVGSGLTADASGVLSVVASTQVTNAATATDPAANTTINVTSVSLPAGKWLITGSQLTVATGTVPAQTSITTKMSQTNTDVADDAFCMSASIVALSSGGRYGSNIPSRLLTLAATTTVFLNYRSNNALTGTIYGQLTALKLS